jgi:tRNA(Ile)-lysidine synthase
MSSRLSPEAILEQLKPWMGANRWWLGLSGGLDSSCLLHLLSRLESHPPLTAVHIDHQLNPMSATWSAHCERHCAALGVDFVSRRVDVRPGGAGPEAAARAARYTAFEELLEEGELLLLAHHADDQVETFFLRLLRGAGTHGLTGMPASRPLGSGSLLRPLLDFHRSDLETYAREESLDWVEDDSNRDPGFDRNYLRHTVLPRIEERWPGYRDSVEQLMQALVALEEAQAHEWRPLLESASGELFGEPVLDLERLAAASAESLAWVLRAWLREQGQQPPGRARLEEFLRQLQSGAADSAPGLALGGFSLQRYQNRLHLYRPPPQLQGEWTLDPGVELELPGLGALQVETVREGGFRLPAEGSWKVRFRQGGERCQPLGRAHSQSLKKLLQESAVPPWWRHSLPLLYAGDELAAVADRWVCEGQQAGAGEAGYRLRWSYNSPALD